MAIRIHVVIFWVMVGYTTIQCPNSEDDNNRRRGEATEMRFFLFVARITSETKRGVKGIRKELQINKITNRI